MCLDDRAAGEWCKIPYPGHPKGCPNLCSGRDTCPPLAPKFLDVYDAKKPIYVVAQPFDLAAHVARMKAKHPEWSDRQARCVLYWQGGVRKLLRQKALEFKVRMEILRGHPLQIEYCPEAMGVNVIKTAKRMSLPITTHPKELVWKIAMMATLDLGAHEI